MAFGFRAWLKISVVFFVAVLSFPGEISAQYTLFSDATQTVTVTGYRDRCQIDVTASYTTVVFGCPGHPLSLGEMLYGYILPAMVTAGSSWQNVANVLLDGYKAPCIRVNEGPNIYANRVLSECTNDIANKLPAGAGGLADRKTLAFNACLTNKTLWLESAHTGTATVCSGL